jgi:drug/metabolite transporter (DMT)-like permease
MPSAGLSRLYILSAAFLFSTGGAAIKLASLSSWQIAGYRSGFAAFVLWVLMPSWRRWWRPRVLAVGVPYAATLVLYVIANTLTTAANAIFLQTTAPLYVLLLGPRLLKEKNRPSDLLVISLLAVGMAAFYLGSEEPSRTAPLPAIGNLLAGLSGVTWALTLIGLRWLGRKRGPCGDDETGAAVVAGNALAFSLCLPLALQGQVGVAADWLIVAYLGIVQIGIAYVCMVRGVRGLRALEVSLLLLLEPLLNATWSWLIHAEQPGAWSTAGCAFILIGVLLQLLPHSD